MGWPTTFILLYEHFPWFAMNIFCNLQMFMSNVLNWFFFTLLELLNFYKSWKFCKYLPPNVDDKEKNVRPELILLVDPHQEGLLRVVVDAAALGPVTLHTSGYQILQKGNITKMPRITALLYLYSSRKIPAAMWFLIKEILQKCRALQHYFICIVPPKYQQLCGS